MLRNISEDTITANILNDELKRKGVRCQPFEVWKTSLGVVKPDLHIWNGGTYVVESKFKKRDHMKALAKIYDSYIKICEELDLAGGFAVLYPEQLTNIIKVIPDLHKAHDKAKRLRYSAVAIFSPNDHRNTEYFEGTISELADWISIRVNKTAKIVEPDIKFIIEMLRQGIGPIYKIDNEHISNFCDIMF